MKRILLTLFMIFSFSTTIMATQSNTAHAASKGTCNASFLSFPAWYSGIQNPYPDCGITSPAKFGGIELFIWKIILNILNIMLQLVGYVSVVFVIYGGFIYLTSAGDSGRVTSGRKILLNAIVGLVISFFSVIIVAMIGNNIK